MKKMRNRSRKTLKFLLILLLPLIFIISGRTQSTAASKSKTESYLALGSFSKMLDLNEMDGFYEAEETESDNPLAERTADSIIQGIKGVKANAPADEGRYFDWKNWQKDSVTDEQASLNPKIEYFPSPDPDYEKLIRYTWKQVLGTRGDTIPQMLLRGFGEAIYTNDGSDISQYSILSYTKYSPKAKIDISSDPNWFNFPPTMNNGVSTELKSQIETKGNGQALIYSVFPDNVLPNLSDDKSLKNNLETRDYTEFVSEYMYSTLGPVPEDLTKKLAGTIKLLNPQVVKVQFRDRGTKQNIVGPVILGKGQKLDSEIKAQAKEIGDTGFKDYELINYEYFDDKGKHKVGNRGDKEWTGKLTTDKQGIIFWYDKKQPEPFITKTSDKPKYYVGEMVQYTFNLENQGSIDLEGGHTEDILDEGMGKPTDVKLDGVSLQEGNAGGVKNYYIWDESKQKMDVYFDRLVAKGERKLTYNSEILNGKKDSKKRNRVIFSAENTGLVAQAQAIIEILETTVTLHVKQEVVGKHNQVVVPKTGYMTMENVKTDEPSVKNGKVSFVMPSYEADTNKPFKDIKLEWHDKFRGYLSEVIEPQHYIYDGYQLTTNNVSHQSNNRSSNPIPMITLEKDKEYWITVYVKPKTSDDGPPYYNWDYETNDFNRIYKENFFDWDFWQKDADVLLQYEFKILPSENGYDVRHHFYTYYTVTREGDTKPRLEDYGRQVVFVHTEHPSNPIGAIYPKMKTRVTKADDWQNIPVPTDPVTKEAEWNGVMATNSGITTTGYTLGGFFLTPTPNPPKIPLKNMYISDDEESNFWPNDAVSKPIIYDWVDTSSKAEVYTEMEQNLVGVPVKLFGYTGNRRIFYPQVVKVQFRDMKTKEQISTGEVLGLNKTYDTPVTARAKPINGYTLDHFEYLDHKGGREIGNQGVSEWNGNLSMRKKGIIFWYKRT